MTTRYLKIDNFIIMRAANYSSMNIYNKEQIKEINAIIKSNLIEGKDDYAADSHKTSDVKFVNLGKVQKYIYPFIDFLKDKFSHIKHR